MRIKLTPEADNALQALIEQVQKANPFIEVENGRLLSAIVSIFHRTMSP